MQNKETLTVLKKDLDNCGDYESNENCLLSTACKRQFDTPQVFTYSWGTKIKGIEYEFPKPFYISDYRSLKHEFYYSNNPDEVILTLELTTDYKF